MFDADADGEVDVDDLRSTWRLLLDENLSRAEARASRAPFPRPLLRPSRRLLRPSPPTKCHQTSPNVTELWQAKEMLLMAEEAVGDKKLEGRLTLSQLRRFLSGRGPPPPRDAAPRGAAPRHERT